MVHYRSAMRFAAIVCCALVLVYTCYSSMYHHTQQQQTTSAASMQTNLFGTDADTTDTSLTALDTTSLSQRHHHKGKKHGGDSADSKKKAPSSSSSSSSNPPLLDPTSGPNDHTGISDENIFDEPHQRRIADMYGDPAASKHGRRTIEEDDDDEEGEEENTQPIAPDASNPYSFPGMTPNEDASSFDYGITIDCGSHGSRAHIYKWRHRHSATSIPPFTPLFTKHAWSQKVTPGISNFVDAPEMTLSGLAQLIGFAKNSLSAFRYKWNRTPIYVKATAGMRLIKNLPSRDRIMETIRTYLSDPHHNPFYFDRTMARVISGEEEGVYGWMTTNYLTGTLMHASSATSYGTLDMGGASVQITFRPPFDVLSNYFPLRLQQEKIRLYTHSFLNFGIERALERVNDRIIELGGNSTVTADGGDSYFRGMRSGVRVFHHPCFPLGFSFTYVYVTNTDLAASFSGARSGFTDVEDGADLSPITTYRAENSQREMVQFEGSQDFANCSAITWALLHKRAPCFDNTCSFDGIYQPRFGNVTFLAMSEFAKIVTGDLQLRQNATLAEIDHRTREICSYSWQKLQDIYRYTSVDSLSKLCFHARYIFTVLYKGFGFPYQGTNLRFVTQLLDLDLSWALGATLYEANAMPWDIDGKKPGHETFRYNIGGSTTGGVGKNGSKSERERQRELEQTKNPHLDRDDETMRAIHSATKSPATKPIRGGRRRGSNRCNRPSSSSSSSQDAAWRREAEHEERHRLNPMRDEWTEGGDEQGGEEKPEEGKDEQEDVDKQDESSSSSDKSPAPSSTSVSPWSYPSVWAVVGFLLGGWFVTGVSFFYAMKRAPRYEPIPGGEA